MIHGAMRLYVKSLSPGKRNLLSPSKTQEADLVIIDAVGSLIPHKVDCKQVGKGGHSLGAPQTAACYQGRHEGCSRLDKVVDPGGKCGAVHQA